MDWRVRALNTQVAALSEGVAATPAQRALSHPILDPPPFGTYLGSRERGL